MKKNENAEKVVKDFTAANNTNNDFENTQAFAGTPANLDAPVASSLPEYRKEYTFEYNGKKIAGGWFNDDSVHSFAQGLIMGLRQFRSTAKIAVYTMNPKHLEWMQS